MSKDQSVDQPRIFAGVDTHKDLHFAAIVDVHDRVIANESFASTRQGYNTKRPRSALGCRPPAPEAIVPLDRRPTMHVWMPPCVQEDFEQLKHVIGCGHVSGLFMRHWLRGRGPVWRCADWVQFTNASFVLCA